MHAPLATHAPPEKHCPAVGQPQSCGHELCVSPQMHDASPHDDTKAEPEQMVAGAGPHVPLATQEPGPV